MFQQSITICHDLSNMFRLKTENVSDDDSDIKLDNHNHIKYTRYFSVFTEDVSDDDSDMKLDNHNHY